MTEGQMQQTILMASQPTTGGVARHVIDLSEGLAARGWDVTIACPFDGWLTTRLDSRAVKAVELPMGREIRLLPDLRAFIRLFRLCRRLRPTVLHVHASKAGFLGRVAGRLARVPIVVFTPNCWSFQLAEGTKRRFYAALERFASRFCDMTIAVSQKEIDDALALKVLDKGRITIIHNAVRPARDGELPKAIDELAGDTNRLVVAVGRPDEQKGHAYLVDAMKTVVEAEPAARLIVAGDGPLIEERRRQAATLGLAESVHFVGEIDDVGPLLYRADLFALSSLWGEGLPYTILEAMTAGLAVVTTDVGGCAEIVQDGRTGLVVPPKDAQALAKAIQSLLADPGRSARMGEAGRESALADYTLEGLVGAVDALYGELMERAHLSVPQGTEETGGR